MNDEVQMDAEMDCGESKDIKSQQKLVIVNKRCKKNNWELGISLLVSKNLLLMNSKSSSHPSSFRGSPDFTRLKKIMETWEGKKEIEDFHEAPIKME